MSKLLGPECRQSLPGCVRNRHTEKCRVDERSDNKVSAALDLCRGVMRVHMDRARGHGQHAKHVILGLGDGSSRPVTIGVSDRELFEPAPEPCVVDGHQTPSSRPAAISALLYPSSSSTTSVSRPKGGPR